MTKCRWLLLIGALLVTMTGTAQLSYSDNSESVVGHASLRDSLVSDESSLSQTSAKSPLIAVKTNLLYDVAVIPNIGVELRLGSRWSVAADWFYTWFSSDNRHRYWQGYGGYFTVRRYFVMGRCVASAERVKDGTWRNGLKPGIYVVNGKKISIKRQ